MAWQATTRERSMPDVQRLLRTAGSYERTSGGVQTTGTPSHLGLLYIRQRVDGGSTIDVICEESRSASALRASVLCQYLSDYLTPGPIGEDGTLYYPN